MSTSHRARVHLEVWTTRLHRAVDDPDLLDITRRTAGAHEKKIHGWDTLTDAARFQLHKVGVERAHALQLRGLALVQAQRLALDDGYPSLGAPWAPTWDLLAPTKVGLELADRLGDTAMRLPPELRRESLDGARELEAKIWQSYLDGWTRDGKTVEGFPDQMRRSWRLYRSSWDWALGRRRVILGCLCARPKWWPVGATWEHCHRFLTAGLFVQCGAVYLGELPEAPSPPLGLDLG